MRGLTAEEREILERVVLEAQTDPGQHAIECAAPSLIDVAERLVCQGRAKWEEQENDVDAWDQLVPTPAGLLALRIDEAARRVVA